MVGIAHASLISQDGSGASGPSSWFTSPLPLKRNSHTPTTATDAVVADVSYESLGCSISQASTSVMTDLIIGRPVGEALAVLDEFAAMATSRGTISGNEDVLGDGIAFAGVSKYPARVKCALLGWMAFKDATAQTLSGTIEGSTS